MNGSGKQLLSRISFLRRRCPTDLKGSLQQNSRSVRHPAARLPARSMASSPFPDLPIPETMKESIKSSILDHASKDNTRLWNGQTNGFDRNVAQSSPPGSVDDPTLVADATLHDPLDDLYIRDQSTRYWPHLPPSVNVADPVKLADTEIRQLAASIRQDLIGTDHPVLNAAASYFFESAVDGGFFTEPRSWQRPDLAAAQRRLAEISEMIHTASLFHDDVIDGADTRRGMPAVHTVFGNKMAILAGDYLLARASICLARLRNVQVVETMSTIIEHLVRGEVMQMRGTTSRECSREERVLYYLQKNFYKTGSLMANSCRSAALLGDYPANLVDASYRFGKHVGMAFQLVDDVLDFEGSQSQLGKPALADLQAGLATAPVLFAAEEYPQLNDLIDRKFKHDGDIDEAVNIVFGSSGIERTKLLARLHAEHAMDAILELGSSDYRDALIQLAYKVVSRTK